MSTKNLARDVESIALALSEEGGYEYYHIDDDLRELEKNVQDMQAENAKLGATDARPTQEESSGTCHITDNGPWGYPYVCSACGASFDTDVNNGEFNYCPNCGRRIEQ